MSDEVAFFLDVFAEPENNLPLIPPLLADGPLVPVKAPFDVKAPDVTVARNSTAASLLNIDLFPWPLGQLVAVVRRDVRWAFTLTGTPAAWNRVAWFTGAASSSAATTCSVANGAWFPFCQATSTANPYQAATGPECARTDELGYPALWTDCLHNNSGGATNGSGITVGGLVTGTTYIWETVRERAGQRISIGQTNATGAGTSLVIALAFNASGWYSIRFTDNNAGGLVAQPVTVTFNGSVTPLWHCPAPAVGANLTNIEGATAISGMLMISNASALQSRDGQALIYPLPPAETAETLMFSSSNVATGNDANDMFSMVSNKPRMIPESAPNGARGMLGPPARDVLVLDDVCDGDAVAALLPSPKNDEVDEVLIVFQFGPAPVGAPSNDVMYYNGCIGWVFSTDNAVIPAQWATMRPTRWDDLCALGQRVVPTGTTNAFHIKELWGKIRQALRFGGAILPVAEAAAAIIPGGQAALPFLAGANSAVAAGNMIGDAAEAAFTQSRRNG